MIWSQISTDTFELSYESYLRSLAGAIQQSVSMLKSSPSNSIQHGRSVVLVEAILAESPISIAVFATIEQAVALGALHARGEVLAFLKGDMASDAFAFIEGLINGDAISAQGVIRRQALVYSGARQRMTHAKALMLLAGEFDDSVFSQLTRGNRTVGSSKLALGHLRLAAAQSYAESFATAAQAGGHEVAYALREGHEPITLQLDSWRAMSGLFHPNTPYTLSLEP